MNPLDIVKGYVPELKESFDSAFVASFDSAGITQYIFWMFITFALTLIVVLVVGRKLQMVPHNKFINMVEYGYQFIRRDVSEETIGHGYKRHVPFLATLFFFILISNVVGLIPGCKTPTGSISVTWALGIISFIYFNYWGIKAHGGWGYIKSIAPSGLPIFMVPIIWFFEFVSMVLRALTLSVRLYGNMFAGHMALGMFSVFIFSFIQSVIEGAFPAVGGISIVWMLFLIALYALETLVAFLQAYVFTILSAVYIQLAVSEH